MIHGLGLDIVAVDRLAAALARSPHLVQRLFTEAELAAVGWPQPKAAPDDGACLGPSMVVTRSLAARFAAKEALAKALGAPGNLAWHDAEVLTDPSGQPHLTVHGTVAARCAALGITDLMVSLTHDSNQAAAIVLGQGES